MRGMFLSVSVENAEFLLPTGIDLLGRAQLQRFAQVHQVCMIYRQRGLAQVLRDGVPYPYFVAAMQSCGALVQGLQSWPEAAQIASYAGPLFDAFACGYWDGAAAIANASRTTPNPDYDYEDDFLYVRFLFAFALDRDRSAAEAIVERYAEVLDGPPDARLELCTALLAHDAEAFGEALVRLLDERDDRVQDMIEKNKLVDDVASWIAHVSVEGLALLAIATREGLETAEHYLHCPAILRQASPYAYDPNAWRALHYVPFTRSP